MQGELAVRATVRRGIEGAVFGAKAGAGVFSTRLGRLVFGFRESRAEAAAETSARVLLAIGAAGNRWQEARLGDSMAMPCHGPALPLSMLGAIWPVPADPTAA